MPVVSITNFGNGIARDYSNGNLGECSMCGDFDILTYPRRLQPLRNLSVGNEPTNTTLGKIIVGYDGLMYGIGNDLGNPANGELYLRTGFGSGNVWDDFTTQQLSGAGAVYDFLVHWAESGASSGRNLFWASTNTLSASKEGASATNYSLTFSNIGQGLVHPKDKKLYFPYQNSTTTLIGILSPHANDFGGVGTPWTAFSSTRYRAYCLTYYGDFLAIPFTQAVGGGVNRSIMALWDRDTTLATFNETIPWGEGSLKVANNLNGYLIGISESLNTSEGNPHSSDMAKIQIKVYAGGAEPTLVKELVVQKISSTTPSATLNPRVNFIHDNRLYFSANLVGGGQDYYGLFSVGKNNEGIWTVVRENVSAGGVLAAEKTGDFVSVVDGTLGNIESSLYSTTIDGSSFGNTASYESCINPEMPEEHKRKTKKLVGVYARYLPLPVAGEVSFYYRVDSTKADSWVQIFNETINSAVRTEKLFEHTDQKQLKSGVNFEFKITSIGGAIPVEYGYKYEVTNSEI